MHCKHLGRKENNLPFALSFPGLLATLNGLIGGIHYGFGKGTGSLIGGALIAATGSTAYSFRIFGYVSAAGAVAYTFYQYCISAREEEVEEEGRIFSPNQCRS